MLISKAQASRILGITLQALDSKLQTQNPPTYFVNNEDGRVKINTDDLMWKAAVAAVAKFSQKSESTQQDKDDEVLANEAGTAILLGKIAKSKIDQEKAKQEEIKTAELMKELAPLKLIKYFFSYCEKINQQLYRKPFDIQPQVEALFLAGESKKATDLIVRELESIVVQVQKELIDDMESEGYRP